MTDTLKGRTAWLLTDGKAGHEAQALGVAEALGVVVVWKRVAAKGAARLLAPWGPADRSVVLEPPWPSLAIAVGRTAIPALRRLGRLAGPGTYRVVLQDPHTSDRIADLIWVPEHDRRRGLNVITTLTPPHRFGPARLAGERALPDAEIDALPAPRVMLSLGGTSKVYRFTPSDIEHLSSAVAGLAATGASLLVTPSRRTPAPLLAAIDRATAASPRILWTGETPNPYARFLAKSDAIVVTADSASMVGEACATGRPVYMFVPSGGSPKFARYHSALLAEGCARLLPADGRLDFGWSYPPRHAAAVIADEIETRWLARARALPGLIPEPPA